jgi:hypothetical protein
VATPAPAADAGGATTYEQHLANRRHDVPGNAQGGGTVVQPGRAHPVIAIARALFRSRPGAVAIKKIV